MTCLICGSGSTNAVWRGVADYEYGAYRPVDYVRCSQCGAIRQSPLPDAGVIPSFYPPDYRNYLSRGSGSFFSALKHIQTQRFARRLGRVVGSREAKVLELGCGNGALLMAFKELGFRDLSGSDFDGTAQASLMAAGIRFRRAGIEQEFPFPEQFDAIILVNVIEHFLDPVTVLRRLIEHLAPGGKVILITPNAAALDLNFFGRYWSGFHAPRHIWLFSGASIVRLGRSLGFANVTVGAVADPGQWGISVQNGFQATGACHSRLSSGLAWYTVYVSVIAAPLAWLQNLWPGRSTSMAAVLVRGETKDGDGGLGEN